MWRGSVRQSRCACWKESDREGCRKYYPYQVVTSKAEVLDTIGKWAEAEELYRDQLEWAHRAGLTGCEADSLNALGWMHHQRNEDGRARELISQALSIYEQMGDSEGQARAHSQLGGTYYQTGEYPQAMEHYRRTQELTSHLGDLQSEAKAMNNIGNILGEQGDNDGALRLYEKSLEASLEAGNAYMEAVVSGNIGAAHFSKGDYRMARDWFTRQMELGARLGNKLVMSSAFGSLAGVHLKMGEFDLALEYISRRIRMAEEIGDIKGQALAWDYLGNVHYTKGEHGQAENAFLRAVQLGRQANIRYYLSGFLRNLASVYLDAGRTLEAEEANSQALAISQEIGVQEMVVECRLLEARILSRHDPPGAVAALRKLLPDTTDQEQEADIHRQIHELAGDENSRLAALEIYRKLNEKNHTIEYRRKIDILEQAKK